MLFKRSVPKIFSIFTGKDLRHNLFLIKLQAFRPIEKETPTQVFFCEYYEILKNSFFIEHLRWLPLILQIFIWSSLRISRQLLFEANIYCQTPINGYLCTYKYGFRQKWF